MNDRQKGLKGCMNALGGVYQNSMIENTQTLVNTDSQHIQIK